MDASVLEISTYYCSIHICIYLYIFVQQFWRQGNRDFVNDLIKYQIFSQLKIVLFSLLFSQKSQNVVRLGYLLKTNPAIYSITTR